ncbi:MAG: STAS/SEC14 domain-containing protein [Sulfuricella sp.]|nr:STAS/SEC14 domain-containing protein [Sulfuricella sp.]
MITIENREHLVNAAVFGEFTLADVHDFEMAVNHHIRFEGRVNILLDLRDMADFSVDVAWEDFKFAHHHQYDFWKIAVVTDNRWVAWTAWLSSAFVDAGIQVFEGYEQAEAWVIAA